MSPIKDQFGLEQGGINSILSCVPNLVLFPAYKSNEQAGPIPVKMNLIVCSLNSKSLLVACRWNNEEIKWLKNIDMRIGEEPK